jgi:hypothetical protein
MSILQSVGTSLLGLPSTSQEAFSVNYLTLTYKGECAESFQIFSCAFNGFLWRFCFS